MENSNDLKEYISNQIGLVFCGSYHSIQSKPWFYDQFLEGMLEASLHLLRKANDFTITSKMGDPVYIARALSRIDGTRPLSWMGSAPILEQYMDTGLPVKYGQCWVFSHVFTTVARALGLPCRSVTNFSSAHDTNLTMTIDKYVDEEGDEMGHKNDDSVWNFHVWNEVWIRRPDLDKLTGQKGKYDGWHAVDATPQELSDCTSSTLVKLVFLND
ncbi:protein-glutamine gamma-glutamyltransferase 4, partial [Plakobranchus ocellatus]